MGDVYLESRLDFLRRSQNPDGGWGYFARKQSWMEPSTYAMLALWDQFGQGKSGSAWAFVEQLQNADGGWRPCPAVGDSTWVTALALLLKTNRSPLDQSAARAAAWLRGASGSESRFAVRLASYFGLLKTDVNVNHRGWPWWPGNSAWIEPTALTVLALKKAAALHSAPNLLERAREGEELILSRRGHDGGWNSGNPSVLKVDVPSYPETTALALLGLQGRPRSDLGSPLDKARSYLAGCKSSLARAWLTIALRCYGQELEPASGSIPHTDVLLCALESLAHPSGNWRLLQVMRAA